MNDRVFYTVCALAALGLIALALVWPQGMGARSPDPFGRPLGPPAPVPAPAAAPAGAAEAPPPPAPLRPAQAPAS